MSAVFDHTILEIAVSNKRKAFELTFNQYWQMLYMQAYRKVQSQELARDLVQDTFLVLWDKMDTLDRRESLLPFLYGVLRNRVLQHFEKDAVRLQYVMSRAAKGQEEPPIESWLQHKHLQAIVMEEIGKMPPRMKEIYGLKKEENLAIRDIAVQLNISEQTVKNQLQEAYTRLRVRLKDYPFPIIFFLLYSTLFSATG